MLWPIFALTEAPLARTPGDGAGLNPEPFPQLPRHPPTHRQRRLAAPQPHRILPLRHPIDAVDVADADQRIAMNSHEAAAELLFQRAQRVIDEILAAGVFDRGVFL